MRQGTFFPSPYPVHIIIDKAVKQMIDFDEELKKFHPSLEVDDTERAVMDRDEPDILDLLFSMLGMKNREKE